MDVNIDYVEEFDILAARNLSDKVKMSRRLGNVIVDLDFNDKAIGVEIMNASKVFGLTSHELNSIKKGKITNIYAPGSVMIKIVLPFSVPCEYIIDLMQEQPELIV